MQWRKPGTMKYLIGVRVSDCAEKPWVRESPFHCVIFFEERRTKLLRRGAQDFESAAVKRGKRFFAFHEMERSSLFGARLGQKKRTVRKIEGRKSDFAARLRTQLFPVKSSRYHQVKDEVQVVFKLPHDLLADADQVEDGLALRLVNGRVDAPEQKWAGDADFLHRHADDSGSEAFDVDGNVGEFGQDQVREFLAIVGL